MLPLPRGGEGGGGPDPVGDQGHPALLHHLQGDGARPRTKQRNPSSLHRSGFFLQRKHIKHYFFDSKINAGFKKFVHPVFSLRRGSFLPGEV
jgi:hypothetical protein